MKLLLDNVISSDLFSFIPQCLYYVCASCLQVIDFAQLLFRKIIGLDTYSYGGTVAVNPVDFGDGSSGDLILQILQKIFLNEDFQILKTAFISMLILSAIILVITTITAIIRVEYNPNKKADGKKDWGKGGIVWNMIKAIIAFFAIPVVCYFGVFIGNIALYGLDQATAPNTVSIESLDDSVLKYIQPSVTSDGTKVVSYDYYIFWGQKASSKFTPMSGTAIRFSLYSANKARLDSSFYNTLMQEDTAEGATINFGIFNKYDNADKAANAIDTMFMLNAKLKNPQQINTAYQDSSAFKHSGVVEYFDRYDVGLVSYYYNLWYFNWPVAIAFILIAGKVFLGLIFGVIGRVYMVFGLLLASPLAASMWPIDGGSAVSSCRKKLVATITGAYSTIVAINLFYLIYPIISSFSFFGNTANKIFGVADYLFQLFFLVAGLLTIKKLDGVIAGFISGESILSSGESLQKEAMGIGTQILGTAGKAARVGVGATKLLASPITAGVGAAHNYNKMRRARNKFENKKSGEVGQKAAKSDDEINSSVSGAMRNTDAYKKEFDKEYDKSIHNHYEDYKSSGGTLSEQDWKDAEADGSALKAEEEWNNTVDKNTFKDKSGHFNVSAYNKAKSDFMKQKYDESGLDSKGDYKHWMGVAKKRKAEIKNATGKDDKTWNNIVNGSYDSAIKESQMSAQKEVDKKVSQILKEGNGEGELAEQALKQQKAAQAEREQAKQELMAAEDKFKRQQKQYEDAPTYGQRLKRYAGSGAGMIGKVFSAGPKK